MHTYIQQRSTTFRTYTGSGQNQQYPPTPILSGSYFSPNPLNAQLPGFQGGLQSSLSLSQSLPGTFLVSPSSVTSPQGHYGSPSSYTDIPPCFGSPGISSKKQQWIQQSTKNTRMIQSGQFQPSAIAWIFVSNADVFPPNAINFGNESNQSFFICRSFYENQLRVGKVFLTHEGLRAFVICKGKESQVKDYEVLVQSSALPQYSFVQTESSSSLSPTQSGAQSSLNSSSNANNSYDSSYRPGHQNTLAFAHGGPQTQSPSISASVDRMDWVQKAQQLTATLRTSVNPNLMVPYAWFFVNRGVAPSNAIVCGNENGQDTLLCRSFYEGQLRYGTVVAGSTKAVVADNGREISVDQYDVLVQPFACFYSFASGHKIPSSIATEARLGDKSDAAGAPPDLGNIQAEIVPGLPKAFEYFIFFQIDNVAGFRDTMRSYVIPKISTAREVFGMMKNKTFPPSGFPNDHWEYVGCSVGFSSRGLAELNLTDYLHDEAFHRGQKRDAKDLGDAGSERNGVFQPDWDTKYLEDIHGVFQITAHNNNKGTEFVSNLRKAFAHSAGIKQVLYLSTKFRPDPHTPQEHFGFRDGIAKPEFKGYTFDDELPMKFAGSPVVDPGLILMGRKGDLEKERRPSWAIDGSFFVFRKLKQLVPEFHAFLQENGAKIFPTLKPDAAADKLGARIFGRWKSGTPVVLSPDRDDKSISDDPKRVNNFQYPRDQSTCPFAAHTQKSYPRNNLPGSNDHLFRRASIPYGGEVEADELEVPQTKRDRGLIFLCYQSSIERGFKYTQQRFNNPDFPSANLRSDSPGYDAVLGTTLDRYMTGANPAKQSERLLAGIPFVEAKGGEYFFMPSIATLNQIATSY